MKVKHLFEAPYGDDYSYGPSRAEAEMDRIYEERDEARRKIEDQVERRLYEINIVDCWQAKYDVEFEQVRWGDIFEVRIWRMPLTPDENGEYTDDQVVKAEWNEHRKEATDDNSVVYEIDYLQGDLPDFTVKSEEIDKKLKLSKWDLSQLVDDLEAEEELKKHQQEKNKDEDIKKI